jgi:uncharacterized membrane protein YedE/YeeE
MRRVWLHIKATLVGLFIGAAAYIAMFVIVAWWARAHIPQGAIAVSVYALYWPLPTALLLGFIVGFWWTLRRGSRFTSQ